MKDKYLFLRQIKVFDLWIYWEWHDPLITAVFIVSGNFWKICFAIQTLISRNKGLTANWTSLERIRGSEIVFQSISIALRLQVRSEVRSIPADQGRHASSQEAALAQHSASRCRSALNSISQLAAICNLFPVRPPDSVFCLIPLQRRCLLVFSLFVIVVV